MVAMGISFGLVKIALRKGTLNDNVTGKRMNRTENTPWLFNLKIAGSNPSNVGQLTFDDRIDKGKERKEEENEKTY